MNTFKYQTTFIPDLHFNSFTNKKKRGEVSISASIGIPKDLSKLKLIKCDLLVDVINSTTKETDISFKSISSFEISSPEISEESLLDDAANYCIPIALQITEQRFEEISKLLIGKPISLQLFQHIRED